MSEPRRTARPRRRRLGSALDERLRSDRPLRRMINSVFPDQWSFALGEVALYCFVILLLTGTYLTFFFDPSEEKIVYQGRYVPLDRISMSKAFASTLDISFDVRGGLLVRQVHHWAALLFVAAIFLHLMRTFFHGAFRKPRELSWVVGVVILVMSLLEGFTGYTLPDDVISGASLHIADSIVLSIPVVGTWLMFMFCGGPFPGPLLLERLYVLHVLVVPGLILALIGLHLALVVRQRHTQPFTPDASEKAIVGVRTFPVFAAKSGGRFLIVTGVLAGLGGLAQINPTFFYGPFEPSLVSSNSQPDWYMMWLEGGLKLFPPWEIRALNHSVPPVFWPGVVLPTTFFVLVTFYPWMERRFTHDHARHHVAERCRDAPTRTAFGVGGMTFYIVLAFAATDDGIASLFHLPIEPVMHAFQVLNWLLPVITFAITRHVCRTLARREQQERDLVPGSGRFERLPGGDFAELASRQPQEHQPSPAAAEPGRLPHGSGVG